MKVLLFLLSLSVGFHLCSCDSDEITNELTAPRRPPPPPPPSVPPPPRVQPTPPPPTTPPPNPPPPPPSRPQPGYDYFVLALTWPNAYCQETDVTCNPSPPKQYFTIHGLWPNKNDGLPLEYCEAKEPLTDDILKKYEKQLLEFWPRLRSADNFEWSKNLWYVQWRQHGSCSSNNFPPDNYIAQTIKLGSTYGPLIMNQLQAAGIKPDGKAYGWEKITEAIKKATGGKDGYLTCENDTSGQLQLSEIRICFEADAVNPKNCGRKPPVKCRKDLVFASPPSPAPPPPKSLDTSIFVSSILEVEEAAGFY
ncbi:hypothetical protein L6164_028642 [Bauhinia variegata]|uniref:Uncharacterized protein n=1 Tax=Bauhinia variegata TaxID=167791 RepID=A0ACB9L6T3_BAUVA|nr:hypothetical protein L6164_028642 [Bauhinia variegata]